MTSYSFPEKVIGPDCFAMGMGVLYLNIQKWRQTLLSGFLFLLLFFIQKVFKCVQFLGPEGFVLAGPVGDLFELGEVGLADTFTTFLSDGNEAALG